jgi:hypothetical protein
MKLHEVCEEFCKVTYVAFALTTAIEACVVMLSSGISHSNASAVKKSECRVRLGRREGVGSKELDRRDVPYVCKGIDLSSPGRND